ncbi:hypothetical protein [Desulfatitalea tepidiphila]|uniref:hypothetical protein n=1 Tax=Desulfatitalea tepidiphila TaxID=1185843 RepID=UPI0006B4A75B|nr:hypothetical protein [Desulfatitalea tepidiphila]
MYQRITNERPDVGDHVLGLLENLHRRIERLERGARLPLEEAEAFADLFERMQTDETHNLELHTSLIMQHYNGENEQSQESID